MTQVATFSCYAEFAQCSSDSPVWPGSCMRHGSQLVSVGPKEYIQQKWKPCGFLLF